MRNLIITIVTAILFVVPTFVNATTSFVTPIASTIAFEGELPIPGTIRVEEQNEESITVTIEVWSKEGKAIFIESEKRYRFPVVNGKITINGTVYVMETIMEEGCNGTWLVKEGTQNTANRVFYMPAS